MIRGLTTAAAGMLADERMQQLLVNNLANLETPGFKASDGAMLSFPNQLLAAMAYGPTDAGGSTIGTLGTGVVFQEGVPLFVQGDLTQTGRNLDVGIVDTTPAGTYGTIVGAGGRPVSAEGVVTAGTGGRLSIGGQPLAVLNGSGSVMPGVYAVRNPNYHGQALVAADGRPDYDTNGNPSYLFANPNGQILGSPSDDAWEDASLRVGNEDDMGWHSFFPVAYQSPEGPSGIALTRDGHFSVDAQHTLVDAAGHAVLPVGANGQVLTGARIRLNPAYQGTTLFGPDGQPVYDTQGQPSYTVVGVNNQPIPGARLGVVDADVTQLEPLGETEYMVGGSLNPQAVTASLRLGTGRLQVGSLEQSNVDATSTMTQMLAVIGQYQANQQVIQTEDALLDKAVNDIGRVNLG
ncbi:MAG: flagellar basal body rod protein [Alicyclobacillus herbarius]|uniref:flagellar hook-basal body protein n=1 Tax=Alicyclobacillus herbarius TaxID=122960 RepID=UPI00235569A5|nr:flagellar basal body rod C-terminal domain-containing protein [Alicyclobacillus herbarius]MCL6631811.1 flagellar basal body rod protein [Alicyclobacillus herbarius]